MSAFLFHRSLRLDDNLGLIRCVKDSSFVLPIFCVDPRQANPKQNPYFSPYALGFMLQSLLDLQEQLQKKDSDLLLLVGEPHKILPSLFKKKNISKLYMNKDFTPFARERVKQIQESLPDIEIIEVDDYLLYDPSSISTKSGTAFKVYTSFYNSVVRKNVDKPVNFPNTKKLVSKRSMSILQKNTGWNLLKKYSEYSPLYTPGGRTEALRRLKSLSITQKTYKKCRDYLTYTTTNMSAYIKFGCVSIREAWEGFSKIPVSSQDLKRQLIWREFYYHYYIAYPDELEWSKKQAEAKLSPSAPDIVKACFKQLDNSGWLHNRGRMILANYILHHQKDYWKAGDKMYAKRLVDYDPIINIGNWRWIDKQPKFKWLKPKTQYEKWDKGCPSVKPTPPKGSYTEYWLHSKKNK